MPPTIGEILKQTRLDKGLSITAASQATAIRPKFLEALESNDFESLPSPVQTRGFLRIYAGYLGLDLEPVLASLRGGTPGDEPDRIEFDPGTSISPSDETNEAESASENEDFPIEPEPALVIDSFPEPPLEEYYEEAEPSPPAVEILPLPLSQSIFVEIGSQLRGRRELLSLSLDEIEQHTHIRKRHLMALEAGALHDLPSPVQARGIFASYARFLDLDSESILLRFAEGLQASRLERHPRQLSNRSQNREDDSLPAPLRRFFTTDLVFGGGMILAMIAFAVWGANRIIAQRELELSGDESQQSISEALLAATEVTAVTTELPTPSLEVQITPGEFTATPTPFEIPAIVKSSPVQVVVAVSGNTWIRVTVDGKIEFQGRTAAGSALTFDGQESIGVLAADGSLVQIIYNQEDLGPMGDANQITELIYTPQGILAPTPTSTPTPTRTPRVTPTFTPSRTPSPIEPGEPLG